MQDLRFALRLIATQRWFSAAVIVTLALGIGLNTTAFTLVNAVLFKAVPFPDGERLVAIGGRGRSNPEQTFSVSWPDFQEFRAQSTTFETMEAASVGNATISEPGVPAERYRLARTTSGFFGMVRTAPVLGRVFNEADEKPGAPGVVVLGHQVWRNRYSSSPDVIGRPVRVNEQQATVIGVMPDGFRMPNREDIWMPFVPGKNDEPRGNRSLLVIALMKPGITMERASADLDVVADNLASSYPEANKDIGVRVQTFHERFNGGNVRSVFMLMLAAVALVLLVACANVANMMLGRALARNREMSVRAALGASRGRLVRQLLVESLVLSLLGAAAGLGLAKAGVHAFDLAVANTGKPSWIHFTFDYAVLGYCLALCVCSSLAFGLVPALRSSRVDLAGTMKEGGRSGSGRGGRLSGVLIVAQFTLALVLLSGASLMVRSLVVSQAVNADMPRQEVMTARVSLPVERYPDQAAQTRFFDDVLTRLSALPNATATAVMSQVPGLGSEMRRLEIEGVVPATGAESASIRVLAISSGYFRMFDLPILRGRALEDRDGTAGRESVVVTQELARKYWPDQEAVGKRLRFIGGETPGPWLTVLGVSGEMVQGQQETRPESIAFVPFRQETSVSSLLMATRTRGDANTLAATLRSVILAADIDLALFDVRTFQVAVSDSRSFFRVFAVIFSIFGAAALLMAAIGLYAVMAQATARRTREIGIRMAVGATPGRILATVMRRGVVQLAIGLGVGLPLAVVATGGMRSILFGVAPTDPVSFATAAGVLLAAGLLACWLPAWRASHVSPIKALGYEER